MHRIDIHAGMIGSGKYGIPVIDSTNDRVELSYFPISDDAGLDNYATVLNCFQNNILQNCMHLSETWLNVTISN